MSRILITGVNSFIGTNFIKNSTFKNVDEISLITNNLSDIRFKDYEVVLHLAAIVHAKKKVPKETYFKINKELAVEVARQAKNEGVRQYIFLSTMRVYGKFNPTKGSWLEDSDCFPDDDYGQSKFEAEIELKKLEDSNFTVSIIRPPLVYGEGVPANMLSIIKLVEKIPILPFRAVENTRYFVSAENLVAYIDQIIKHRASGIFIAADEKPLSTTELVRLISKYLNRRVFLFAIPKFIIKFGIFLKPNYFEKLYGSFAIDNAKTLSSLEMEVPFSTEEGIKKMILYYMESKKQNFNN